MSAEDRLHLREALMVILTYVAVVSAILLPVSMVVGAYVGLARRIYRWTSEDHPYR